jgi:hypothetical protein
VDLRGGAGGPDHRPGGPQDQLRAPGARAAPEAGPAWAGAAAAAMGQRAHSRQGKPWWPGGWAARPPCRQQTTVRQRAGPPPPPPTNPHACCRLQGRELGAAHMRMSCMRVASQMRRAAGRPPAVQVDRGEQLPCFPLCPLPPAPLASHTQISCLLLLLPCCTCLGPEHCTAGPALQRPSRPGVHSSWTHSAHPGRATARARTAPSAGHRCGHSRGLEGAGEPANMRCCMRSAMEVGGCNRCVLSPRLLILINPPPHSLHRAPIQCPSPPACGCHRHCHRRARLSRKWRGHASGHS